MGSERNATDKLKNAILGTKCFLAFDFFYKEEQPEVPHNQTKIPTFSQFFCTNLASRIARSFLALLLPETEYHPATVPLK
ncbi:MAG: hypothetical protein ABSE80_06520 [Halobacteriota archaeon]|jgi:hypothetical protein